MPMDNNDSRSRCYVVVSWSLLQRYILTTEISIEDISKREQWRLLCKHTRTSAILTMMGGPWNLKFTDSLIGRLRKSYWDATLSENQFYADKEPSEEKVICEVI